MTYAVGNLRGPTLAVRFVQKRNKARGPYMLVNQNNADILALFGKPFKGGFDGLRFGLVVHDKEVLLAVTTGRHML